MDAAASNPTTATPLVSSAEACISRESQAVVVQLPREGVVADRNVGYQRFTGFNR
jgi:hypothetical protein